MSAPVDIPAVPFAVEIPRGWHGVEAPRPGVALELVLDEPVGFASRMLFEVYDVLDPGSEHAGPMETLIGQRVSELAESMTDGMFLDMGLIASEDDPGDRPGFTATVAYRHGPHLVTALLWALPLGDGALVITGLTDADALELDVAAFSLVVESLQLGPNAASDPSDPAAAVIAPASGATSQPSAPPAPTGWDDAPLTEPAMLRQLVAEGGASHPAVVTSMRLPHLDGDEIDIHAAVLADLAMTMTDPELCGSGEYDLAVGAMRRSVVAFRQADSARIADVMTAIHDRTLPAVWSITEYDDDAGRAQAIAWLETATRAELGA